MKKIIFILVALLMFTACEKETIYPEGPSHNQRPNPDNNGDNDNEDSLVYKTLLDKHPATEIDKVYNIPMLREFSLPLNHYILRLKDGNAICCMFLSYDFKLKSGDKISKYYTYKVSPNEAYEVHTPYGVISYEEELKNVGKKTATRGLILSDTKETVIKDIFYLKIRQTLLLFPPATILPVNTMFIVTDNDELLYVQDIFESKDYKIGDKISYKVLNLCPSKIMFIENI